MPDTRLEDIGFADFVAMLLVETLDSIVASHTSQEERLRALESAASFTAEEFAIVGITDEMAADALARLFPDGNGGTVAVKGGPVPDDEALDELDVRLSSRSAEGGRLTEAGAQAVIDGVRLYLARQQLEAVQAVTRRGVPRVLVDGGTLRARMEFTVVKDAGQAASADPVRIPPVPAPPLSVLPGRLLAVSPLTLGVLDTIRTNRLVVRQPASSSSSTAPSSTAPSSTAAITGEVEIRFRAEL